MRAAGTPAFRVERSTCASRAGALVALIGLIALAAGPW